MAKAPKFGGSPIQIMAIKLQELEAQAYRLGMAETARAINSAMNKVGWEAERILLNMEE